MRLYLDNCCFNRPFDDQKQIKVKLETEAKLAVQKKISDGEYELIWSYILEFENSQNPYADRLSSIREWKNVAAVHVIASEELVQVAEGLEHNGLKPKDALHIACAIAGGADYFLTTDKRIINKDIEKTIVINPIDFVRELEDDYAK